MIRVKDAMLWNEGSHVNGYSSEWPLHFIGKNSRGKEVQVTIEVDHWALDGLANKLWKIMRERKEALAREERTLRGERG